jgi:polyhydroxyalkanoate depolymerase
MLYQAYQAHSDFYWPLHTQVTSARMLLERLAPLPPLDDARRRMAAAYEVAAHMKLTHQRPPFGIETVEVAGREVEVTEHVAYNAPFGALLHFRKDIDIAQPRVLIVAPMSGHFATLLRDTVRTMLRDHDVYVTDWRNARDVPLLYGRFGFDEYITHLIAFLEAMGPGSHVLAVCQPCVAALAAAAMMAENHHVATPRSLTLMAGPIDCRINPTRVNALATSHTIDWFEAHLIAWVPLRFRGACTRASCSSRPS